ncbi:hypothetical protein DFH06DRAFT_314998 [Mycena polygramma]|nr:hypothetical protein DFH06DRAFT_377799 [Mycena polygramma]KAJ7604381.1 hypothetical protein DFH06DRAFT_314998 [Mycena polygramma]
MYASPAPAMTGSSHPPSAGLALTRLAACPSSALSTMRTPLQSPWAPAYVHVFGGRWRGRDAEVAYFPSCYSCSSPIRAFPRTSRQRPHRASPATSLLSYMAARAELVRPDVVGMLLGGRRCRPQPAHPASLALCPTHFWSHSPSPVSRARVHCLRNLPAALPVLPWAAPSASS